jgi:hypothetical protein
VSISPLLRSISESWCSLRQQSLISLAAFRAQALKTWAAEISLLVDKYRSEVFKPSPYLYLSPAAKAMVNVIRDEGRKAASRIPGSDVICKWGEENKDFRRDELISVVW